MADQSRESEKQILLLEKDIQHLNYVIKELEKECDFVKKHFTKKNTERLDEIKIIHGRIDQHLQTDIDFHDNVRKKISVRFSQFEDRVRQLERWKWATWGALIIVGTLITYFIPVPKVITNSLL